MERMRLDKVLAGYKNKIIVRDVSLEIEKGEIICLIGPNGGGKSTLLKSMNGSLKLIGGAVYLGEKDLSELPAKEIARQMSIVTTERIKPQLMTCRDVVLTGRLPFTDGFGTLRAEDKRIAEESLFTMKIEHLADTPYEAMSDGQKQRTLIARAICQEPKVLIMDEPTSYMDIKHRLELMDIVKDLANKGITVIMSLHELELALDVADRTLLVYEDGHVEIMKPSEVLESGLIKTLYDLDDEKYKKVAATLGGR